MYQATRPIHSTKRDSSYTVHKRTPTVSATCYGLLIVLRYVVLQQNQQSPHDTSPSTVTSSFFHLFLHLDTFRFPRPYKIKSSQAHKASNGSLIIYQVHQSHTPFASKKLAANKKRLTHSSVCCFALVAVKKYEYYDDRSIHHP